MLVPQGGHPTRARGKLGDQEIRPRYRTRHDAGKEERAHHGLA